VYLEYVCRSEVHVSASGHGWKVSLSRMGRWGRWEDGGDGKMGEVVRGGSERSTGDMPFAVREVARGEPCVHFVNILLAIKR
jgi:hypothetical protein